MLKFTCFLEKSEGLYVVSVVSLNRFELQRLNSLVAFLDLFQVLVIYYSLQVFEDGFQFLQC